MKKKTLLSIAIAAMVVAAMSVTAFAAPGTVSVSGPSSVEAGEQFTVTVSGTGEGVNGAISATGATIDSVGSQLCTTSAFVLLPVSNMPEAVYTLTATGEPGTTITVSLTNVQAADGSNAVDIPGDSITIQIKEVVPTTEPPTTPPTVTPTPQEPTPTVSDTPTVTPSGSVVPTASVRPGTSIQPGTADKMPKTGDATVDLWVLAVIAAGCAGAAIVAGKKVFSHK